MSWQDKALAGGGVILTVNLIPTLINPEAAVPLLTSVPTGLVLLAFAYTMFTLELRLATATNFATAVLWLAIAALRHP